VPRLDGGVLEFTDVPVYVLDLGFGIDGILGMNLFNGADSFMYDPYNPEGAQVSALFLKDRTLDLVLEESQAFDPLDDPDLALLKDFLDGIGVRYAVATPLWPGLYQVPEPSTLVLGLIGFAGIAIGLRRKLARRSRA